MATPGGRHDASIPCLRIVPRAADVHERARSTRRWSAAGTGKGDAGAHNSPRPCARGQPGRRPAGSTCRRLPAAQLRTRDESPLPGALFPARLHGDRRGLRQVARDPGLDRSRHRRRGTRGDRRHSRRLHEVQRQHVLEFADHRLLGDIRRRRPDGLHRQALQDHRVEKWPWSRRTLNGRLRHDAYRHEAGTRLRGALCHELMLPDERSGGRTRRRTPGAATQDAARPRAAGPLRAQARVAAAAWPTRCPRRRPRGRPTRRTRRSSSTCRRRTARSSRSLPRSGSQTRRSSSSISTCRRSDRCVRSRSTSATRIRLSTTNRQLADALTRLDVPHTIEVYEGDHGNRIRERFEMHVLPFFSRHLTAP